MSSRPAKRPTKKYKSEKPAAVLMKVPRGLGRELKTMDVVRQGYTSSTASVIDTIVIGEGTGFGERIGRRVFMQSFYVRAQISLALTGGLAQTADDVRLTIVLDRQPNKLLPAILDMHTTNGLTSFPNTNTAKRFKVLYDQFHPMVLQLGGSGATGQAVIYKTVNVYLKKQVMIEFANSNNDYTGISTNNLVMIWQSTQSSITTNTYMDTRVRMRYYDD